MKHLLVFFSFTVLAVSALGQLIDNQDPSKLYKTGYRNIFAVDSSRNYKQNVLRTDKLYYRPVEIDLWYPSAGQQTGSLVKYGELLNLLQERSNRFQDDTLYKNMTEDLVQYICANLKISDTSKLTLLPTRSYANASPGNHKFPLIIYMSSFNGMSYENTGLFEQLAANGYIVACITSVGKYPGNMGTDTANLMEQVRDGIFAINLLKTRADIDTAKIGALGYSWGGLAALLLAMNNNDIKSLLSFDGSEMHYYGESAEEDKDFDQLRNSPFFNPGKLNIPYTYLESDLKQTERNVDSIFDILPLITTEKKYFHFFKTTHEDFSFLASLPGLISGKKENDTDFYKQLTTLSINYFNHYLKYRNDLLSLQASEISRHHLADTSYPHVLKSRAINKFTISGKIMDAKDKLPVAYVNVGVPGKNIGTVTQHDGSFLLAIPENLDKDSVVVSMVGYQSQELSINFLLKQKQPVSILLKEKTTQLATVTVSAKTLPVKIAGNTTKSKFMSVGFPLKFLGSEVGVKIKLGKKPVRIKSFNFTISDNRLDTAVFRLNIYNLKNGAPFQNILADNILLPVGKQTGAYTINLSYYNLVMQGDVLVSLEWIEGSSTQQHGAIFLSAGFLNSATWHRYTSQGEWKKFGGIGAGFNLGVQKIN